MIRSRTGKFNFLDLATRFILRLPTSSGTTSVRCISGHTSSRKEIFFSQEHHVFFEQPASAMSVLINCLLSWSKHRCNCLGDFPAYWRRQASLVEEAQDGVLPHNTWCSGTSCGGINSYNLTARLGPGGLAHHEDSSRLDPTARSFAQGNKTWRSSRILVG